MQDGTFQLLRRNLHVYTPTDEIFLSAFTQLMILHSYRVGDMFVFFTLLDDGRVAYRETGIKHFYRLFKVEEE